jgi:hypothetical protein
MMLANSTRETTSAAAALAAQRQGRQSGMVEPMSSYKEAFPKGTRVRVRHREFLQQFSRDWKFHHPLQPAQLAHAGVAARVASVCFYHGGGVLYELQDIEGLWHEACLMGDDAG